MRPHVDFVGSSERWGVEKPSPEFFERVADEAGRAAREIAYVGDRVDNDVLPAQACGHVRGARPPRAVGHLHEPRPTADARIESLDELPPVLA